MPVDGHTHVVPFETEGDVITQDVKGGKGEEGCRGR